MTVRACGDMDRNRLLCFLRTIYIFLFTHMVTVWGQPQSAPTYWQLRRWHDRRKVNLELSVLDQFYSTSTMHSIPAYLPPDAFELCLTT